MRRTDDLEGFVQAGQNCPGSYSIVYPEAVYFVKDMPKARSGEIMRHVIKPRL